MTLDEISNTEIERLWARAGKAFSKNPTPRNPSQFWCTLFLEPSTRTKLSFQLAIDHAGCKHLPFDPESSSLKKQESLLDTFLNLEAMQVYGIIVRTPDHESLVYAAKGSKLKVINAGSGNKAHPTQALLDGLTLQKQFGKIEGLKIAFIGDIAQSRVAKSGRLLFERMGAHVLCAGPQAWIPSDWKILQREAEEIYKTSDAVILLRAQLERSTAFDRSVQDYLQEFGGTSARLKQMKSHAVILHPGPCNRGIEITDEVLLDPKCLMFQQVSVGVQVRTALIDLLSNGDDLC